MSFFSVINARAYIDDLIERHPCGFGDRFIEGQFCFDMENILGFNYGEHVIHEEIVDDLTWFVTEKGDLILPKDEIKAFSFGHDFGWTNPAAQVARSRLRYALLFNLYPEMTEGARAAVS